MKKRIVLTAALILLCGCSDTETENGTETLNATSISTSVTAETEDDIEEDYDYVIKTARRISSSTGVRKMMWLFPRALTAALLHM